MTAPGQAGGEAGLAIERVEVVPAAPGVVHVRVVGAWHGRLIAAPRAVLVAGAGEARRRVEPVPEPRDPVGGWAGPRGEWRATFAVAEALLADGAVLEVDGRALPLPGLPGPAEPDPAPAEAPGRGGTVVDHPALAERRARGDTDPIAAPAPPPPARRATVAGREATLARGLAAPGAPERTEPPAADPAALPHGDPAPAPGQSATAPPRPGDREAADRVAGLRAQVAAAVQGVSADLAAERAARSALEGELVRERDRRAALEAELARRRVVDARLAAGVAAARGALAEASAALAAQPAPGAPSEVVRERMDALRAQVDALRARAAAETLPAAEPAPAAEGVDPERLGAALARLRASVAPESVEDASGDVDAVEDASREGEIVEEVSGDVDAVEEVLRDREAAGGIGAQPEGDRPGAPAEAGPVAPWLPAALRTLAAADPAAAGRAVVALLPAQGIAVAGDLTYDLALRKGPAYAITVRDGATEVLERTSPRPRRERDFAVRASLPRLGAWAAGRRRRGVRGRRRAAALRALAAHPHSLAELDAAGVRPGVDLAWRLVAAAVDPSWTEGHALVVRHDVIGLEAPAGVIVRSTGDAPLGVERVVPGGGPAADATIRTTPGAVLAAMRGASPPPGEMVEEGGDAAAIALLRGWIARAERGIRPSA